ncbi:MAG TPA: flavodoxin family protein [Candidatus Bathyarchaeia archaeon]|nr:flavodoxin family protein [Candidatus Bathyarchaeia archaeon]
MKTLIIFTSIHHQNTIKIAEVMAKVLKAKLLKATKVNPKEVKKFALIGFGSGIYFGRHHQDLFELLDKMPTFDNKKAFIFSTRGSGPKTIYHQSLKNRLKQKGFQVVGEFSCSGWDTFGVLKIIGGIKKGHPDKSDLKKAEKFAKSLLIN